MQLILTELSQVAMLFLQSNQRTAIENFLRMVKPGGILVIDHRNYDEILATGSVPAKNIYYNVCFIFFNKWSFSFVQFMTVDCTCEERISFVLFMTVDCTCEERTNTIHCQNTAEFR